MIYLIILTLLYLASTITLAVYVCKNKKYLEDQIDEERYRRIQLEKLYMELHGHFAEHYAKYH